jgi:hypothetical protein
MTVYILRTCERDEDSEILGVFSTHEAALTALDLQEWLDPKKPVIVESHELEN